MMLNRIRVKHCLTYFIFMYPCMLFIFIYFGIQDIPLILLNLLAFLMFFSISFPMGCLFPLLIEESSSNNYSAADRVQFIYGWEVVGMGIAGLALFFLMDHFNSFILSIFPLFINLIVLLVFLNTLKMKVFNYSIIVVFGIILMFLYPILDQELQDRSMGKWGKIMVRENSRLGQIHLMENEMKQQILTVNRIPIFSTQKAKLRNELFAHIPYFVDSLFQKPSRILIIGGGTGSCIGEYLKYSDMEIDYVEINRKLFEMSQKYLPSYAIAVDDPRINIYFEDGWRFLQKNEKKYDIILIDLPLALNPQISRFFTYEFAMLARKRLNPLGIITIAPFNSLVLPPEEKVNEIAIKTYMTAFRKHTFLLTFAVDDLVVEGKKTRCTPYFELAFFSPEAPLNDVTGKQISRIFENLSENIEYSKVNRLYIKSVFALKNLYYQLRYTELANSEISIATIDKPNISFYKWLYPAPPVVDAVKIIFERNPETGEIVPSLFTKDGVWTVGDAEDG